MTYNVRNCRGVDGQVSHERIAAVIERYNPDIVALQEVDAGRERSGRLHQAREIGEILAMEAHFHPAIRIADEEYGDAILSKHPLRVVRNAALPEPDWKWVDEARGALWVEISVGGKEVQVINTHFGLGRAERRLQADALLGEEWVGAALQRGSPLLVCGDFNSPSGGVVHAMFRSRLRDAQLDGPGRRNRRTFSTTFPLLCLDYVFVSEGVEVVSTEVPRCLLTKVASDHYPLIVDFEVAPTGAFSETATGLALGERLM